VGSNRKSHRCQSKGVVILLCLLVLSWPFTATRANDDIGDDQTAYLTSRHQPEHRNITVFDNALVDKLFGKDRLTKQEDDKNRGESENAIAPSTPTMKKRSAVSTAARTAE
jgi:hypothetical protein